MLYLGPKDLLPIGRQTGAQAPTPSPSRSPPPLSLPLFFPASVRGRRSIDGFWSSRCGRALPPSPSNGPFEKDTVECIYGRGTDCNFSSGKFFFVEVVWTNPVRFTRVVLGENLGAGFPPNVSRKPTNQIPSLCIPMYWRSLFSFVPIDI